MKNKFQLGLTLLILANFISAEGGGSILRCGYSKDGPAEDAYSSHLKHTPLTLDTFSPARATNDAPPFGLPFNTPPGPATWILSQLYGNTTSAYLFRRVWYAAGQGLHFGLDFAAPCGTEVVAIGDGVVVKVDASEHGAGPHNLLIRHEAQGYVSLYGHLLQRPQLFVGQQVRQGDVVGLTGDPDETCTSRPHLHLEIRNLSYTIAYNPVNLIQADWDSLTLVGQSSVGFQRDLYNPRRWQFMEEQPEVHFGGPLLNDYAAPWPPAPPGPRPRAWNRCDLRLRFPIPASP